MKQGLSRRYGYDSALTPARGSLKWFWFAAARPFAIWSLEDAVPVRRRRREPKPRAFAHG
jgi:hypothetical protein